MKTSLSLGPYSRQSMSVRYRAGGMPAVGTAYDTHKADTGVVVSNTTAPGWAHRMQPLAVSSNPENRIESVPIRPAFRLLLVMRFRRL